MIEVVNPFDSTGFTGKKKADQTGRRNFFGREFTNKTNFFSVMLLNWQIPNRRVAAQREFKANKKRGDFDPFIVWLEYHHRVVRNFRITDSRTDELFEFSEQLLYLNYPQDCKK